MSSSADCCCCTLSCIALCSMATTCCRYFCRGRGGRGQQGGWDGVVVGRGGCGGWGVVGAAGELGGAGEDAQQTLPSARQPPCAPSDSAPAPKLPTSKRSPMASAMSPKAERICGLMFRCTSGDCRLVSSVCRPRGGKGHTRGAQHAEQELDWAGRGRNTAPELSSRPALRRSRMQKFLARHADSQPPPGS